MTCALLGRTPGRCFGSMSAGAANARPRPAGSGAPGCVAPECPARGRPRPARPGSTAPAAARLRRQGCRPAAGRAGRRVAADQTDDLASLGLVQAAGATRARPVTESLDTLGVEAVQPLPHGLGMAPQPLGDLTGALALPASDHDAGAQDPVGGCMAAGRQPAHSALLVQVSGRSGVQQRRHGMGSVWSHPGWTGTDRAFNYIPYLRNAALGRRRSGTRDQWRSRPVPGPASGPAHGRGP